MAASRNLSGAGDAADSHDPSVAAAGEESPRARPAQDVFFAPEVVVLGEDVAAVTGDPGLPGEHRGGFRRALTEPVELAEPALAEPTAGTEPVRTEPTAEWAPDPAPLPRAAPWALTFAILGLVVSFLVGWGFLIGLTGAILAILALRRPWESRAVAVWALCLSLASLVYSAGWLWWASTQGPLFG